MSFEFLTYVSGQHIGSIITGQESKKETGNPSTGWAVISFSNVVIATNGVDAVGSRAGEV